MMKILNRNPEILVPTWMVGRFGPDVRRDRPFDAAFIVKATFQLAADGALVPREGGPLQPEGDRWIADDPALGLAYSSDFVPTKPRGEYTVVGTAHRPASASANRFPVAVEVAGRRKTLVITGMRSWEETLLGHRPGVPGYVDRQSLTYAAALGGPKDAANPIGIGRTGRAAPVIEHADRPPRVAARCGSSRWLRSARAGVAATQGVARCVRSRMDQGPLALAAAGPRPGVFHGRAVRSAAARLFPR